MKAILFNSKKNVELNELTNIAAGFGGGMAHEGLVCGAVSGAIAAIGLLIGYKIEDIQEHKQTTYHTSEKFVQKFKQKHKSIICNELTGIQMKDNISREKALQDGLFYEKCPAYVEDAVRIALEIMRESN